MTTIDGIETRPARARGHGSGRWRPLLSLATRLRHGRLCITLPDGRQHIVRGSEPGPSADIALKRPRFIRRFLTGGALGFAEAYIDGDCDSADLTTLLELAARNEAVLGRILAGRSWVRAAAHVAHLLRPNSRAGSRRNIAAHYDLGNGFYAAWLDSSMTYSGAVFTRPNQPLAEAQGEKYRRIARLADLRPEHHVLEIGCGWGGFAEFAAREIGCRVTAATISEAQYAYARCRIAAAGLDGQVEIALCDYRDLAGSYDRIVSIEMVEAVGERWWPTYFRRLHDLLTPGGRAALQAITIADDIFPAYRRRADFIQRYIFPGGMLPSASALRERAAATGLIPAGEARHGANYAQTLRRWREAFEAAWPEIRAIGFDERFRRTWLYYLAYCEAGFRVARIDLHQLAFVRPAALTPATVQGLGER